MLATLLALSLPAAPQTRTVALYRGAQLSAGGQPFTYWQVEDTFLDQQRPDSNFGGLGKLSAGSGKTILIKFGDLARAIGPNKRIKKASLILTLYSPGTPSPKGISQLLAPWGEGALHVFSQNLAKAGEDEKPPDWSSTYRHRRAGAQPVSWQMPGAGGGTDARSLSGASVRAEEGRVFVEGLANAVQSMVDRWYENHGFALSFNSNIEFESSQGPSGRPTLLVEYEEVTPLTGADLSVTYIERTPEFDRYEGGAAQSDKKRWPVDGEAVTYTAHVKNVGTAPSGRYFAQWVVAEKAGAKIDLPALQPGQEMTVRFDKPFKNNHSDHRQQPLGLRIEPQAPDATSSNNALDIQEGAMSFGIAVEKSYYDEFAKSANLAGSAAFEDWMQEQFRIWNDTYMAHSRFSFAPMGSLERCRIQRISIVPDGSLAGAKPNLAFDGEFGFRGALAVSRLGANPALIKELSEQLGLADLGKMDIGASEIGLLVQGRAAVDPYPGVMGGGDSRNEAGVPKGLSLPYEPVFDSLLERIDAEASDLYSATEVAALNSNLGKRRGIAGDYLYDVPAVTLIRAVDWAGRPLAFTELAFYQSQNGRIEDGDPTFTLKTDASGSAVLPSRATGEAAPVTTATGHTLKNNPFGRIDPLGGNGVFLIKGLYKGNTEWSWLKLWQLVDVYHRGSKGAAVVDIRFNMPADALDPENIAKGRTTTTSAGSPLPALTDDAVDTAAALPTQPDSWVEVDLGRDRTIGEVRLALKDGDRLWESFDIVVYATGEQPGTATRWARELAWSWSARARRDASPGGFSVAYRGLPQRIRYVRLIRRGDDKSPARLGDIKVAAIKVN